MSGRGRTRVALALLALAGCSGLVKVSSSTSGLRAGGAAGAGVGGAPAAGSATATSGDGDIVMPDLIGKTREEAAALVRAAGFTQEVESTRPVECYDAQHIEGRINCQDPAPGERVKKYTLVQINVYEVHRRDTVVLPPQLDTLKGLTLEQAKVALARFHHRGPITVQTAGKFEDGCVVGRVCSYFPAGGIGIDEELTLYLTPDLAISAPPPP